MNLIYNVASNADLFFWREIQKKYNVTVDEKALENFEKTGDFECLPRWNCPNSIQTMYPVENLKYMKCHIHGNRFFNDCNYCSAHLSNEKDNNIDFIDFQLKQTDMEVDKSLNVSNNNMYFQICLDVAKKKGYKVINFISYDGACGYPIKNNKTKINSFFINNIRVNIFVIHDFSDILLFRHANYTFLRGFYTNIHALFKENTIFYPAQCLEYVENLLCNGEPKYEGGDGGMSIYPSPKFPLQLPIYNKILYHNENDYNYYYSRKHPNSELIKFDKFNFTLEEITNNREYDFSLYC